MESNRFVDLSNEVSSEFWFHLADGRVIKSIPELINAIRKMDDWVYNHHVNDEKNDFVRWISDMSKLKLLSSINDAILN
jgi:hypothetical protein